jgi:hypothetical protein
VFFYFLFMRAPSGRNVLFILHHIRRQVFDGLLYSRFGVSVFCWWENHYSIQMALKTAL